MRICENCHEEHQGPYIKYCKSCYYGLKNHPEGFKKRIKRVDLIGTSCSICGKERKKIEEIWKDKCRHCYIIEFRKINPAYHEKHKKLCRDGKRRKAGIDVNLPLLNAPAGSGYIKKGQGYKMICKKEFRGMPHADKKGRIAEHTYIMMKHIGRPLFKGENVHHINGIRDDNRIENLELWHRSQPPGQRVEDKVKWCIEFLTLYGYNISK
jgi:hypothetical protein